MSDRVERVVPANMAKRKASSPLEVLNGDDDKHGSSSTSSPSSVRSRPSESSSASTPKRSLGGSGGGGGGLGGSSSFLPFGTPEIKPQFTKLDVQVSEKMTKVNESFLNSLAVTLSDEPDAVLFPAVESYVRHVHTILTPHLPKYITVLEKDKGFVSIARFLDRFKSSVGRMSDSGSCGGDGAKEAVEVSPIKKLGTVKTTTTSSSSSSSDANSSSNIFVNFKFIGQPATVQAIDAPL